LAIAYTIVGDVGNQGHAFVILMIKPANAHAMGRVMVNGILPGGVGMVVVPLDID
jgi:hypothetical protein